MALGRLDVHAGDFKRGNESQFVHGKFLLKSEKNFQREDVQIGQVKSLEMASEESVKRFGGSFVGGALGGLAFGAAGLLAGSMSGGTGKDVTFIMELHDGRKMMATTDSDTFRNIQAELFDHQNASGKYRPKTTGTGAQDGGLRKARWIAGGVWLFGGAIMTNAFAANAPESSKQGALLLWTAIVVLGWFAWKRKRA